MDKARQDQGSPQRGEGQAMLGARFRDPQGLEQKVAALRLEIARTLVNAPRLPIDLPAFDLTLLSVVADRHAIELVLGKSSPIAKVRLTRSPSHPASTAPAAPITTEIVRVHTDIERFQTALQRMAARLAKAISLDKWERARTHAKELAAIPVDVPLAFFRHLVPGASKQGLVRTGFLCNQDCGICWQDRTWGRFDATQILTWIEDLHAAGANRLNISGGEPTLDRDLDKYIRHARAIGYVAVTLETNAIQFAKPGLVDRLRDAGLTDCFVSLHSGDAATSDAITRAPGTFLRTVAGIEALLAAKIPVWLNCVMTREGLEHLESVPDFIHARFGNHPSLEGLMFSQPTDPFDRSLLPTILPEPERLRAALSKAIDRAFSLGVKVSGLDGPCGPPLCSFGADPRITALEPIPEPLAGRVYLAACDACLVRRACFGARSADVELYGEACVSPIVVPPR